MAPPKSETDFQAITLEFGDDSVVIDSWIEHPPSGKVRPGQFTTYKGNDLVVTVDAFNFYGIHLDVAKWIPDPNF